MSWIRRTVLALATVFTGLTPAHADGSCTSGALVMGNPTYEGQARPDPKGAPIRGEVPLDLRTLVLSGTTLFTHDDQEIWIADLRRDQATMRRIAGARQPGFGVLEAGPCASARFINLRGMTLLPDGSLVVADHRGNALMKVTDPTGPSCAVSFLAGASKTVTPRTAKLGDEDGPGASARLGGPLWLASDAQGNVYFVDEAANKLKRVGSDAEHTVATLAQLTDLRRYGYKGLTLLDGKVYVAGNTFTNAVLLEVDPARGTVRTVLDADSRAFASLAPTTSPTLSSITTDGRDLIVTGQGLVWRVTRRGKISHLAGLADAMEFPPGYDPSASHRARELVLLFRLGEQSSAGTTTAMAYQDGVLFWRGKVTGAYVVAIACR